MSALPSSPRAKEYSELFDFFESLTKRRPRAYDADPTSETVEVETPPVPLELVPLFHRKVSGGRTRAILNDNVDNEDDEDKGQAFPMPRNISPYPFTFKMMIHKIYEEEFLSKCNEFLAKSREQFKPLAEQGEQERKGAGASLRPHGMVLSGGKYNLPPTRPRRHSVTTARTVLPTSPRAVASPCPTIPTAPRFPASVMRPILDVGRNEVRAAKKRCTGRRLSIAEPVPAWVYDSAVASTARASIESFGAAAPAKEAHASRYQGLGLGHPSSTGTPSKKRVRTRAVSMACPTRQGLAL
ncbi:hypothetical protein BD626DRAFT_546898 [Schizophyllum amplum]|uniref:Uncharacterized protein n=1 Tax=Schizophyllum amplum TaxID=97359 RepID=A0A550CKV4_9AGAR|nr:hypothetical protein BD626DRAFT_546898 [Auriculariopsis ampla]